MSTVTGKGSKLFLGLDATTGLVVGDLITAITEIGEYKTGFNISEVKQEIGADDVEVVAGQNIVKTFTVTGNLKSSVEKNKGYTRLATVNANKEAVKFGLVRPGGVDGVQGVCFVNELATSTLNENDPCTFTATITINGATSVFTEPVAPETVVFQGVDATAKTVKKK